MSSGTPELPASGYSLLKVYTTHLEASHAVAGAGSEPQQVMNFKFEWRKLPDDRFDVRLSVQIDPSPTRPERLIVHLVGQFKRSGEPSLPLEQFAKLHSVVILFPYVRQHLSAITMSSFHGPFYLPAVNVGVLLEGMERKKAAQSSSAVIVSSKEAKPAMLRGGRKSARSSAKR